MCGIVGYVGTERPRRSSSRGCAPRVPRLRLRRASPSLDGGRLRDRARRAGKLANLEATCSRGSRCTGTLGIGHTRWATHGRPTRGERPPAHRRDGRRGGAQRHHREPPRSCKERARGQGPRLRQPRPTPRSSPTSSSDELDRRQMRLPDAVRAALAQVRGTYALAVVSRARARRTIVARQERRPLVVGLGEGENFVASDIPALLEHTRDVIFLEDGDMARADARTGRRSPIARAARSNRAAAAHRLDAVMAEKGGYKHFMLKEIHEQPRAVADTLRGRVSRRRGRRRPRRARLSTSRVQALRPGRACSPAARAWHAALVGRVH